jgi:hypothetical protein
VVCSLRRIPRDHNPLRKKSLVRVGGLFIFDNATIHVAFAFVFLVPGVSNHSCVWVGIVFPWLPVLLNAATTDMPGGPFFRQRGLQTACIHKPPIPSVSGSTSSPPCCDSRSTQRFLRFHCGFDTLGQETTSQTKTIVTKPMHRLII